MDYEEIERLSKGVRLAVVDLVVGLGFLLVAATLLFDHLPVVAALVLLALWAAADLAIARRRGFSGAELWPQAVQVVVVFVFAAVLHGPRWQQVGLVLLLLALQFARNPLPPRRER